MICPVCGGTAAHVPVTIMRERGMVVSGDKFVVLEDRQCGILEMLANRFPRMVRKDSIISQLYETDDQVDHGTVESHISKLRKNVGPLGIHIESRRGLGYWLAMPEAPRVISELQEDAA